MHAATIGALEIVKADDRDFGIRISAPGAAFDVDVEDRIVGQVELIEVSKEFVVGGDQEVFRGLLHAVGDDDRQRVITGKLAWPAGSQHHGVIRREVELKTDHDLYVTIECSELLRTLRGGLGGGLGFAAHGDADCEQGSE